MEWWQALILVILTGSWFFAWTVHALDEYGNPEGFFMGPVLAVAYPIMILLTIVFSFIVGWAVFSRGK